MTLTFDAENRMTGYGSVLTNGYRGDSKRAWKQNSAGHAYVTGTAGSSDFPVTQYAYQSTNNANGDAAFVSKLAVSGSSLVYSTYLDGTDGAAGIAVDTAGCAYVEGGSDSQANTIVTSELSADGSTPVPSYSRSFDLVLNAYGIALDSAGNIYNGVNVYDGDNVDTPMLGSVSNYAAPVPPAPTGLTAQADSNTSVSLTWNPVAGASSYNVYRRTATGGYSCVQTGITATFAEDPPLSGGASLTSGTRYYYQVTAVNGSGEGAKSNEASATPGSTPLAAPWIKAVAGNQQVALAWSAVTGATSYNLYRQVGYNAFVLYATGLTAQAYTDHDVTNGTQYSYYVAAVNQDGEGTKSNEASAIARLVPPTPTGLTATPGDRAVTLSWAASPGATSYNVYRATTPGGEGTTPYRTGINSTSLVNTGLTNRLYHRVAAIGNSLEKPAGNRKARRPQREEGERSVRKRRRQTGHACLKGVLITLN